MAFLNLREEDAVLCTLTHYRNCKRLREFEEIGISCKAAEVTVNSKEKDS